MPNGSRKKCERQCATGKCNFLVKSHFLGNAPSSQGKPTQSWKTLYMGESYETEQSFGGISHRLHIYRKCVGQKRLSPQQESGLRWLPLVLTAASLPQVNSEILHLSAAMYIHLSILLSITYLQTINYYLISRTVWVHVLRTLFFLT